MSILKKPIKEEDEKSNAAYIDRLLRKQEHVFNYYHRIAMMGEFKKLLLDKEADKDLYLRMIHVQGEVKKLKAEMGDESAEETVRYCLNYFLGNPKLKARVRRRINRLTKMQVLLNSSALDSL